MVIRKIKTSNSEAFVNEESSEYMLWEAGERNIQLEQQMKIIESIKENNNSTIFVAEKENKLVGFLMSIGGNAKRNRHSAYIVIGILKDYRDKE